MEKFNLTADIRSLEEKTRTLKLEKKLAAVVYGKKQAPISLVLDYSDFLKTFRKTGESHIITLQIGNKNIDTLVHDFQKDPVTGDFIHVDFYAIVKGESVTTKIHLNFIGESKAVKEGGILEELHKEIEIKCLPENLVDSFDIDLSILEEIGNNIKAGDLNLGSKYELITSSDEVIVLIGKPKKLEETPTTETTSA